MNTRLSAVAAASALLLASSPASAFDGQIEGFLLGAGIGPAILANHSVEWEVDGDSDDEDLKVEGLPVQFNWLIGGAWDNQNALFYNGHISYYTLKDDDNLSAMSRGLLTYRRYFQPEIKGPYAEVGAGVSVFLNKDLKEDYIGGAFGAAFGYQFHPHFSVEAGLDYANPSHSESVYGMDVSETVKLTSLYVTINALAF